MAIRRITDSLSLTSTLFQDATRQAQYITRWLALPEDVKIKIKQESLLTLGSPTSRVGLYAAQVVAAIAAVELPENQWQDLIQILLGFINNGDNVGVRVATLSAIGYICENIVRAGYELLLCVVT